MVVAAKSTTTTPCRVLISRGRKLELEVEVSKAAWTSLHITAADTAAIQGKYVVSIPLNKNDVKNVLAQAIAACEVEGDWPEQGHWVSNRVELVMMADGVHPGFNNRLLRELLVALRANYEARGVWGPTNGDFLFTPPGGPREFPGNFWLKFEGGFGANTNDVVVL